MPDPDQWRQLAELDTQHPVLAMARLQAAKVAIVLNMPDAYCRDIQEAMDGLWTAVELLTEQLFDPAWAESAVVDTTTGTVRLTSRERPSN